MPKKEIQGFFERLPFGQATLLASLPNYSNSSLRGGEGGDMVEAGNGGGEAWKGEWEIRGAVGRKEG